MRGGGAALPELVQEFRGESPERFLRRHAAAGRVGLAGGTEWVSRMIRKAQRFIRPDREDSLWSHAFLFTGERLDGHHWVLESDLDVDLRSKQIRLGVQENRLERYFDPAEHATLAVLDFGLDEAQSRRVVVEGLNLLAGHTRYSLRELVGTLIAMSRPGLRTRDNLLARERSLYCSAMVHHCFAGAGIKLQRRVHDKNTTPDDLFRSPRLQAAWLLRTGAGDEPEG